MDTASFGMCNLYPVGSRFRRIRRGSRQAQGDFGSDDFGLPVSRIGRLRSRREGAVREPVRRREAAARGEGRIGQVSKVSLDGKILEEQFLPTPGETLHKPKGIWIRGNRLWVTDIDAVWVFDLKTRKGRKLEIPGIKFANDPAVRGDALYVSDNRSDQLFRVEPADFLDAKVTPKVSVVFSGKSVNPNGLFPARDNSLLIVGFLSAKEPRGIHALDTKDELRELSKPIGRLDGVYQMSDGTLLVTDWNSGSLIHWSATAGVETVASGFKGPADFCVMPDAKGLLVAVPDLIGSVVRLIRLGR
jgi:hypothetical protein